MPRIPTAAPREIVPQAASTIDSASLVGDVLLVSYLVDAKSEVHRFALDGKSLGTVQLPGLGSTAGFSGEAGDPETFYSFASFNVPTTIFHYDSATGRSTPFATPKVAFNRMTSRWNSASTNRRTARACRCSCCTRRACDLGSGSEAGVPTLLYAYGGFNVSMPPSFSPANLAWAEMGGVYVLANIRGGGEYGKAWHDAGRLTHKQNVFDDFIAGR
ncbi:MAG: prolyl oligopeptidase family serine peptidase [Pseudomonadota bacterium]